MIWRFLGAAGFGFGAAGDPVAPAAHDDDVEGWAFAASVNGHVLEFAGAGQNLFHAAEAAGVAEDEGRPGCTRSGIRGRPGANRTWRPWRRGRRWQT